MVRMTYSSLSFSLADGNFSPLNECEAIKTLYDERIKKKNKKQNFSNFKVLSCDDFSAGFLWGVCASIYFKVRVCMLNILFILGDTLTKEK